MRSALLLAFIAVPAMVLAAGSSFGSAMADVSSREWIWMIALSAFAGLASLLQRLDANQQARDLRAQDLKFNEKSIIRSSMPLFAATHMVGAIFVGVATFFAAQAQTFITNGPMITGLILAMAFGGAQMAERSAAAYFRILRLLREQDPAAK